MKSKEEILKILSDRLKEQSLLCKTEDDELWVYLCGWINALVWVLDDSEE